VYIMSSVLDEIDEAEFESKWLLRISSVCKDFNWEVRKTMAVNLEKVLIKLSSRPDLCDEYLFEELLELVDDEEEQIRDSAISLLCHLDKFSGELIREKGV